MKWNIVYYEKYLIQFKDQDAIYGLERHVWVQM